MRRFLLVVLLLAAGVAVGPVTAQKKDGTDPTKPKTPKYPVLALEGKKAPAFTADFAINGPKADFAALEGKVTLLDFWAVWCGPCRAVFPELTRLHETYGKKGLQIVGLTRYYKRYEFNDGKLARAKKPLDAQAEQKMLASFVKHHKLPYRIETTADAFKAYKVSAIPSAVLIDKKGIVRLVKVGSSKAGIKALEAKIKELLDEK